MIHDSDHRYVGVSSLFSFMMIFCTKWTNKNSKRAFFLTFFFFAGKNFFHQKIPGRFGKFRRWGAKLVSSLKPTAKAPEAVV